MKRLLIGTIVLITAATSVLFTQQKEFQKTYTEKNNITIDLSPMSSYSIQASPDQNVHIRIKNADDRTVQYIIEEREGGLHLGDKDLNYRPNRPTPQDIYEWTLELPKKITVKGAGGVAHLTVDSFEGFISISTAAGSMTFENSKGMFDISGASADIDFDHCEGTFQVSTGGNADIDASMIVIDGDSKFSTNGGDVEVILAQTPKYSLVIATGTGDGILDYNSNPVIGTFKFSAEKGQGSISSPFPFQREGSFKDDLKMIRNQQDVGKKVDYLLKEQVIGNSTPEIFIKTIRGRAVLRQ